VADLRAKAVVVILALTVAFAYGERLTDLAEEGLYADTVVFARSTPYQRIVLTRAGHQFQLFLNGNLQFSSADEYRYHEALVHPALALVPQARRVLVLGGGDGLAAREILKHASVAEVVLVDLDPEMTRLAVENPLMRELNGESLLSPKVHVVNEDALLWLGREDGTAGLFDAAIVDFPDPHNFSLGKLYTTRFYSLLRSRLDPDGVVAVQSTSPLMARRSYWCINRTLEAAGFFVRPYHALVPSFGEWGYALGALRPFEPPHEVLPGLRYLDARTLASLFVLGPDMARVETEVNRLNNQALVRYYDQEWRHWN
jgi:spermidine synthase